MNDDSVTQRLGAWLSQRTGIALDDRTTREVRDAELAELRARLEASGRLGRMLNRWIDRMSRPKDH